MNLIKEKSANTAAAARRIGKISVLGSGVMGSRIACHFANIGLDVLLLDIAPKSLSPAELAQGLSLETKAVRNRIVNQALQAAITANPSPLYDKKFASRIRTGNFDDDFALISDSDWVLEAVIEKLEIKKSIFDMVEKYRKPGTLITTNTSGIPIHLMLENRSDDFKKHFCGVHFFNPPRYLKLLEIIPSEQTEPAVIEFLSSYADLYLGKTPVIAKDTPAFIANRVGVFAILDSVRIMQNLGLSIDDIDKLTGPVIGHPKSATFRTSDIVGLDTLTKVAAGLKQSLPDDERKAVFELPDFIQKMETNNWLGDKTGQGFYKKTSSPTGERQILSLNLQTLEYAPAQKSKFATLEATKSIEEILPRFKVLIAGQDKAGEFYRQSFAGLLAYSAARIPEIADHSYQIDDALRTGFGHQAGPFQTWDAIGLDAGIALIKDAGYSLPAWVSEMKNSGNDSFYKNQNGSPLYYDIATKSYLPIPGTENFIILNNLRATKKVWSNAGSTVFDLGEGVLGLEFHTKMNTLGSEVIAGINQAIGLAEKSATGLVIGNQGTNFSAGANLAMLFMYAIEQDFDEINMMIRQFQNTMMRVRYCSVPVVVAPHGLSLGGGCEMGLHADGLQAFAESYIGLVEVGVGLIPAGGGTKEMALRVSDSLESGDPELNALQNAFMNIAMAKVSTSAHEAIQMKYLRPQDRISINQDRQLSDAKAYVKELAAAGYTQSKARTNIRVQGKTGIALFKAGVHAMKTGRYISEHDQKIVEKLAYVICGGDLSYPQNVSEQYLLDLEREAFLSLCGEKKTLERIQSLLKGGKPLRN